MHIITVSSSLAATIDVLLAFSIHKISHRREDCIDLLSIEVTTIYKLQCILRIFFITVLDIDISNKMITKVINDNHILNLSIFAHFPKYFLKELFESSLQRYYF